MNIESGERGELTSCLNSFDWDCPKKEFKECHTIRSNKGWKRGELYRPAGTANERY